VLLAQGGGGAKQVMLSRIWLYFYFISLPGTEAQGAGFKIKLSANDYSMAD